MSEYDLAYFALQFSISKFIVLPCFKLQGSIIVIFLRLIFILKKINVKEHYQSDEVSRETIGENVDEFKCRKLEFFMSNNIPDYSVRVRKKS